MPKIEVDIWTLIIGYFIVIMTVNLIVDYKLKAPGVASKTKSEQFRTRTYYTSPYAPYTPIQQEIQIPPKFIGSIDAGSVGVIPNVGKDVVRESDISELLPVEDDDE